MRDKIGSRGRCADCSGLLREMGDDADIFTHAEKVHSIVAKELKLSSDKMVLVYLAASIYSLADAIQETVQKPDAKTIGDKLVWYVKKGTVLDAFLLHYLEHHYGSKLVLDASKVLDAELGTFCTRPGVSREHVG